MCVYTRARAVCILVDYCLEQFYIYRKIEKIGCRLGRVCAFG